MTEIHLLNIKRNTDFLYYVGKTYQLMENQKYVGIIIDHIVDEIEFQCDEISKSIKENRQESNKQKVNRLFEEALSKSENK